MSVSLPRPLKSFTSVSSFIFDVPEPPLFEAKFIYNFFLKDEKVSTDVRSYSDRYADISLQSILDNPNRNEQFELGRCVKLKLVDNFDSSLIVGLGNILSTEEKINFIEYFQNNIKIAESLPSETDSASKIFMSYTYQNPNLINEIQNSLTSNYRNNQAISQDQLTPSQALLRFASTTENKIEIQSLVNSTVLDGRQSYTLVDIETGEMIRTVELDGITDYAVNFQINKKFSYDILSRGASLINADSTTQDYGKSLRDIERIQQLAIIANDSENIRISDFEPHIPIFGTGPVPQITGEDAPVQASIPLSGYESLGVAVYKYEITDDGSRPLLEVAIHPEGISEIYDYKVIYGKKYEYAIKKVYGVQFCGIDTTNGLWSRMLTFVTSRTSPIHKVNCIEAVPPFSPPMVSYAPVIGKGLGIIWTYPHNPKRDIKKYQVFRRKTIHEPFYLIAELNFDDSAIKSPSLERVPHYLKWKYEQPVNTFIDEEWDYESSFIYAICSVDAHGLSSNYSVQSKVSYDKSRASPLVELISTRGAPKPYPNFNLEGKLVEDAIKDSFHQKLKIYFDPEYLTIWTSPEEAPAQQREILDYLNFKNLSIDETSQAPSYKLQLINLDRQASVAININLFADMSPNEAGRSASPSLANKVLEDGGQQLFSVQEVLNFYINR